MWWPSTLDAQGNLAAELGVHDHDQGEGLLKATLGGPPPPLHPTRRKRLSLIPAGEATARLQRSTLDVDELAAMLAAALAPVTAGARVLIDTAPSAVSPLADAALRVARWLLIPTRCEPKSLAGIPTMLARALQAPRGDLITPIGIVLFDVPARATVIASETRQLLEEEIGGAWPVLDATIRSAVKAQRDASSVGLTAGEYAQLAAGRAAGFARNAAALAEDYRLVSAEIDTLTRKEQACLAS